MSKNQDDRSSGMTCRSRTDGHTDRQTNERHSESADFAKSLNFQVESWEKLGKVGKSGKKWEKVGKKWENFGKVWKNEEKLGKVGKSVLYKFQRYISTISREIKYWKIPISHHWAIGFHGNKKNWLGRFWPKKFARVLRPEYIDCQEIKTIGSVLWPVHRSNTEIQTNKQRQTDRHTVVTNILCEKSQDFRKVMKGTRRVRTLQKSLNLQVQTSRW